MNAIQEETVSALRSLIATCRDGQEGFRNAAECVADDPELKMLLSSFSLQRSKFAGELESQLIGMGEHHPEAVGGSISGAVHRGWLNLKAAMSRADNHAILEECERGEDVALSQYNKVLSHEMPDPVREIVQRQRQEVVSTHNTIRALRDATQSGGTSGVFASARETAREAANAAKVRRERVAARANQAMGRMRYRADEWKNTAEVYVRRNPLSSLGVALLTGFTIGMIFYAAELRNERARIEIQRRPLSRLGTLLAGWFGFLAGRVKSRYDNVVDRMESISERAPERFRGGNRFTRSVRRGWARLTA